jgi:hypothetical protein
MSRDKQIEEMAKHLCIDYGGCDKCTLSNPESETPCTIRNDCETLLEVGYRKSTYVTEEIFAEIDKLLAVDRNGEANLDVRALQRLKKKYTEGKDV